MLELEENLKVLNSLIDKLKNIGDTLGIDSMESELKSLKDETLKEGFWNDIENSNKVCAKIKSIERKILAFKDLEKNLNNLIELNKLLLQEFDAELSKDVIGQTDKFVKNLEKLELETLLSEKYDANNAMLTLHPGAGGTESQDWVEMLYRMYTRWASSNGFEVKELDYLDGEEAGIKSVTFLISGENAYGYLKGENGVHRLVRISPFDSGGRRHTSFASVEVLPEITDEPDIVINNDDLRIDTYRASGAGGQHINKTDSAVRITHIPTGIVVSCQSERSQTMNKETAMRMLLSKLMILREKAKKEKEDDLKGVQKEIAWGSQIRSYVFCPYTLVKDHRTNYEVGNVEAVMNGDLNGFMEAYLKLNRRNNIAGNEKS